MAQEHQVAVQGSSNPPNNDSKLKKLVINHKNLTPDAKKAAAHLLRTSGRENLAKELEQ